MRNSIKRSLSRALAASAAAMLLAASNANAASVVCDGTVSSIALSPNGGVLITYGGYSLHQICSVGAAPYFDFDKDACKAWLAVIQAAKAQQRTLRFYYDSTTPGNPASCGALTYGQNTRPNFMQTLD